MQKDTIVKILPILQCRKIPERIRTNKTRKSLENHFFPTGTKKNFENELFLKVYVGKNSLSAEKRT